MTAVFLVGTGMVGRRAARQLAETEGVSRIVLTDQKSERASDVAEVLGTLAEAIDWSPAQALPEGIDVVAVAMEGDAERAVAERALEAGVPMAGSSDEPDAVRSLLDLDDAAREAGITIAAGCGLAPGLADVLVRHAADALEAVSEIHIARAGSAGPACSRRLEQAGHGVALEWREGAWARERAGSGRQLVWFPDPVGGLDCRRAASGQTALLVDAFPGLNRVTMRVAEHGAAPAGTRRRRRRSDPDGEWGGVWVEVRGRRGRSEEILVYGAVDRMAFAAGTVLALAAGWLAGLDGGPVTSTGAHGLGALIEPVPFLAELGRRGVKAAAFEGSG